MKKHILLILLNLCFFNFNCTSQQKQEKNTNNLEQTKKQKLEKIELREQTRGTNKSFTLSSEALTVSLNENITNSKITLSEWENVEKEVNHIDLSKISSFAAPTTGHYSDQALASTILITSNGSTYQSSSFDSGNPPKELASLYKILQQVIQSKKTTQ
ncbi:hypothetical protein PFY12_07190 [Chryseobacterium camelliae]|uniref:Lipoprotein n=1 Tax=Chryseobacterium camelliae TaxID=1265445 RepID=A0ABY7QQF8_9FLAO|nr:hypothetical protein [Chryseobacterium camelliae]WBV61892.1 hypothetical protein PFY12_07190 [Chryseobacterium camelliae]